MKHLQVFIASHNNVYTVDPLTFVSPYMAHIDLSGNCITCIAGLKECPRLLVADLSRNLIASLRALSPCSLLQVCGRKPLPPDVWALCALLTVPMCVQDLSVNENLIESIDGVFCNHLCLQRLKVATNRLSTLAPLPWLPQLRSLDLSDNPIATLPAFGLQPALTTLNISFCSLSQDSIMRAVAPLGHLADLQAHDNSVAQVQNDDQDASSHPVESASLRTLPWLRDLDHMETRCCDVVSAAVTAFSASPHLLLSWRLQTLSGMHSTHPISTSTVAAMKSQTDTVRQLNGDEDGCSVAELLAALGVHRGVQMPLPHSDRSACGHTCPPSNNSTGPFLKEHAAAQLHSKLQEQYSLLTAHGGACTQLSRSLVAGVNVDQSLCIEQLSTAMHQAQTSAAASVLSMVHWRPQEGPPPVHVNAEWQKRWSRMRDQAASRIQCVWCRRHACREQMLQRRNSAAACIQSWVRGARIRGKHLLHRMRQELHERQVCAVLVIQAAWRGHRVRRFLSRARLAAHDPVLAAERNQGTGGPPSSTGYSEDISLPELGNELMRELNLLDHLAGPHEPPDASGTVANRTAGVLSRRPDIMTETSGYINTHRSETLPQLAARSSCTMAPGGQLQSKHSNSADHGGTSIGVGARHLQQSVDSDSALARRYRQHKMQQAGRPHGDPGSGNAQSSSAEKGTGTGRDEITIPAYRTTVDMPHVHVAALAAIRLRQEQSSAAFLSGRLASSTLRSGQSPEPECTAHSQQEPQQTYSSPGCPPVVQQQSGAGVCDSSRRSSKAENVMKEWGFENESTAKAYLLSKRRMQNKKHSRNARRAHLTSQPHVCPS